MSVELRLVDKIMRETQGDSDKVKAIANQIEEQTSSSGFFTRLAAKRIVTELRKRINSRGET